MTERSDFHLHYYPDLVDGSIDKMLEKCRQNNVVAVGLLGRTTVGDSQTITQLRNKFESQGIAPVFGLEYYARVGDNSELVDLICLDFDHQNPKIQKAFGKEERRKANIWLASEQKRRLEKIGFNFEGRSPEQEEALQRILAGETVEKAIAYCELIAGLKEQNQAAIADLEKQFGRFAEADWEKKNGHLPLANWLYSCLFRVPDGPAYIPVQQKAEELIKLIHQAGGVVLYSPEGKFDQKTLDRLLALGIDGVMAWHGGAINLPQSTFKNLVKKGKLVLGGSDFDVKKDDWQPGIGRGDMFISPRRLEDLRRYQEKKG